MAVEGGMKCVKYLVFIFNFLFWICGCALIGVGIYVLVQMNNPEIFKNLSTTGAPIVIIAVGVVIFFISFFGCCGAVKENYCMVTTFAVFLVLIFLVEIAAAIAGYVYRNQLQTAFTDAITDSMRKYGNTTYSGVTDELDALQKSLQCCGANNATDWNLFGPYKGKHEVPDSCCKVPAAAGCGKDPANAFSTGCVNVFKKHFGIVAGVALGIAFFELLGIVFACCLMKGIRSGYEVM